MENFTEEVAKELIEKVEGRIMAFHTINMLKMMLVSKESGKEEKSKHVDDMKQEAAKDAAEIIALVRDLRYRQGSRQEGGVPPVELRSIGERLYGAGRPSWRGPCPFRLVPCGTGSPASGRFARSSPSVSAGFRASNLII